MSEPVLYNVEILEGDLIPFEVYNPEHNRVLVFAPHPDDETLGCGGAILHHTANSHSVKVIFLTDGGRGDSLNKYQVEEYLSIRENEAKNACKVLGITDYKFCRIHDRTLGSCPSHFELIKNEIDKFRPEIIYVTSPFELNPDHRASAHLVWHAIDALKPNLDLAFYEVSTPLQPNTLIDITPFVQQKFKAAACYPSQMSVIDYSALAMALNRFRSLTIATRSNYAEAYILINSSEIIGINISDKYTINHA